MDVDAHRIFGQYAVDFEERINFDRMRKERLGKLQEQIKKHDLGAVLLFKPSNIRYATSTGHIMTLFESINMTSYALVPKRGEPMLFEIAGIETQNREMFAPWISKRLKPAIQWQNTGPAQDTLAKRLAADIKATMKDMGVEKEALGIDRIDLPSLRALESAKIDIVDGTSAIMDARVIKTKDEIECIKIINAIGDAAYYRLQQTLRPGVRESDLAAVLADVFTREAVETVQCLVVASGGHTNPYYRDYSDKMIRYGDLVIIDFGGAAGPGGYMTDYVRTFVCGNKATEEQKALYKECYDVLYGALRAVKPSATTADVAAKFPEYEDDKLKTWTMVQWGHGLGLDIPEEPTISRGFSFDYPQKLKENMYLAMETYAPSKDGRQGVRLEETFVITSSGIEIMSLCPHDEKLIDL